MASTPVSQGGGIVLADVNGNVQHIVAGQAPTVLQNIPSAFDLAYDKDGGLWITPRAGEALVYYRSPTTGVVTSAILSSAAPDSDEYADAIPRAIHPMADGSMIVLNKGGDFLRIRLNGK